MSSNRNVPPDPNADTSEQDVKQKGGDNQSRRDPNTATSTTSTAPTTDMTPDPVIINK